MIEWAQDTTCLWQSGSAFNGFGDPVFAKAVSFPCRYQGGTRLVQAPSGQVVVSIAKVYLSPADGLRVRVGDQITKDGRAYRVQSIKLEQALEVLDHVVLYLGG